MKTCHIDGTSPTVTLFIGFLEAPAADHHIHVEDPPSPSSWEIWALNKIMELILYANTISKYGRVSMCLARHKEG